MAARKKSQATHDDPRSNAVETLRLLRERMATAEPAELTKIAAAITASSKLLARLDGDFDVTPGQFVRHEHFRPVVNALLEAVAPFPGACEAVAKALRKLDGEVEG